jgi:preprotein translocase subunit SecG
MYPLLLAIHLIVCLCLVAVVLVQSGKGGGLASGAFGGATQTVFGGRGATDFITRATIVLGVMFFLTSLSLALMTTRGNTGGKSVVGEAARRAGTAPPATAPATGAPAGAPAGTAPASPAPATPAPAAPAPGSGTNR